MNEEGKEETEVHESGFEVRYLDMLYIMLAKAGLASFCGHPQLLAVVCFCLHFLSIAC